MANVAHIFEYNSPRMAGFISFCLLAFLFHLNTNVYAYDFYSYETSYFEVLKPITKPAGVKRCSLTIMKNHVFGNIPFSAYFDPPSQCGKSWSLLSLSWSARANTTTGYIGHGDIFIDGVNILKTSAQLSLPRFSPGGKGNWSFEADITKYAGFLKQKRRIVVDFRNPSFPSAFDNFLLTVNLTLNYYAGVTSSAFADVIVPLSPKSSPNAAFNLTRNSNKGHVSLSGLPRNIYRAEVEIFQIQGGSDSTYWKNFPDKLVDSVPPNQKIFYNGGGSFKETLVYVDGLLAGAICQFPVVGEYGLILWEPVLSIGSLIVPSYKIDITAFVGLLVDGKSHNVSFAVAKPSKDGFWKVSGALHLWLDKKAKQTRGKLISRQIDNSVKPSETYRTNLRFQLGNATTRARRASKFVGSISTSFGNFSVTSTSSLYFSNDIQSVIRRTSVEEELYFRRTTVIHDVRGSSVVEFKFENGSRLLYLSEAYSFPLNDTSYSEYIDGPVSTYVLSHGYLKNTTTKYGRGKLLLETLSNTQSANQSIYRLTSDFGKYQQKYAYMSNFGGCYYRNINVSEKIVLSDKVKSTC